MHIYRRVCFCDLKQKRNEQLSYVECYLSAAFQSRTRLDRNSKETVSILYIRYLNSFCAESARIAPVSRSRVRPQRHPAPFWIYSHPVVPSQKVAPIWRGGCERKVIGNPEWDPCLPCKYRRPPDSTGERWTVGWCWRRRIATSRYSGVAERSRYRRCSRLALAPLCSPKKTSSGPATSPYCPNRSPGGRRQFVKLCCRNLPNFQFQKPLI